MPLLPPLEIPIFGPSQAAIALAHGATRLELNAAASYPHGGLTPTLDELRAVRAVVDDAPRPSPAPAVRVMIRPRPAPPPGAGPDFVYTPAELAAMRAAVAAFRASGLLRADTGDGFVFGCLKRHGAGAGAGVAAAVAVEEAANRALVDAAGPFPCVFHRAFDDVVGCADAAGEGWDRGLRAVVACGFEGVLTSGGAGNAPENVETLGRVVDAAQGRLEVIVGGGVRGSNITALAGVLTMPGARLVAHSSCLDQGAAGGNQINAQEVRDIVKALSLMSKG